MFGKKTKAPRIGTIIGVDAEIRGDVHFKGGLHIDGRVMGNVIAEDEAHGMLTLSEAGYIEGEVRVPNVILDGTVNGNVHAAEKVELAPKAKITGSVYYRLIEMAMGAEVNGSLVSWDQNTDKQAPAPDADESDTPA